jgi:hypothetical protein
MAEAPRSSQATLRAEHDDLARRLESRPSVDVARNGFVSLFGGILALGVGWALGWDRYDKLDPSDLGLAHPVGLFLTGAVVAAAVGVALVVRGVLVLRRSRRVASEEAALFRRLLELRRLMEIDA